MNAQFDVIVPDITELENITSLSDEDGVILQSKGVALHVSCVNWPEYPYKPDVTAFLGHNSTHLFCMFAVRESHLSVRTLEDNGPVWEDSCVELFVADKDKIHYYNFETNASGVMLASRRVNREECVFFTGREMKGIMRHGSLPEKLHDKTDETGIFWTMIIGIPFVLIGCTDGDAPKELKLNLYKCGDKTKTPHFLSWAPIYVPSPDFHRPEFFRTVHLQ